VDDQRSSSQPRRSSHQACRQAVNTRTGLQIRLHPGHTTSCIVWLQTRAA
jgi:hypothetical protein